MGGKRGETPLKLKYFLYGVIIIYKSCISLQHMQKDAEATDAEA
jgi:hypothetical protein